MGRFDALIQIENEKKTTTPPPMVVPPTIKPDASPVRTTHDKPANPQTRKTTNPQPEPDELERPEKYTTRLLPSWVKKIRLEAVQKDIKDYEVVTRALELYFEANK